MNGNIGNILVHQTAKLGGAAIFHDELSAGSNDGTTDNGTVGSIGDIAGITDGQSSGIASLTVSAVGSVGDLFGIANSSSGTDGMGLVSINATGIGSGIGWRQSRTSARRNSRPV